MKYLKGRQGRAEVDLLWNEAQARFESLEIDKESVQWCLEELADRDYVTKHEDETYDYLPG